MIYQFINTIDSGIRDVWIPITGDVTKYDGENGIDTGIWKRYYGDMMIGFAQNTKVDPFSQKDFLNATNKKMTMGEMWDLSKELSEKRTEKDGIDHVKEKTMEDYRQKHGVKHQEQIRIEKEQKAKKNMEKLGFEIQK